MRAATSLEVAIVGVVLMMVGCTSGEPAPTPTSPAPTSSRTETTTSEPTVAVPELPAAATTRDAAGAEAFVQHWVEVLNYAYRSGDTQPVKAISSSECRTCADTFEVIDTRRRAGATLTAGLLVVDLVRAPPPESSLALVSVRAGQEAGEEVSSSGSRTPVPATPPANLGFVLRYDESAWSLEGIGNE